PENREETIKILERFKPYFEGGKTIIAQNLKYDLMVLQNYGFEIKGKPFDTMLAHYLIEADGRHGMDAMAEAYLKYKPISIETLIGKKGDGQKTMREVDLNLLKDYAAEDADITLQLYLTFKP